VPFGVHECEMLILFKLSQNIGFVGTVAAVFVWLTAVATAMVAVSSGFSQHPRLVNVTFFGFIVVAAISGLIGFWLVAEHVNYWWNGYRVKWLHGNKWVYEERREKSGVPYERRVRGRGYPMPCTIWIMNSVAWETEAPAWSQSRRSEIVGRILTSHGAQAGADIQVREVNPIAEPE
jgi:hypothetical protein